MKPIKSASKRLVFTVINDINYDQRMIRICNSLQKSGYDVLLIGKERPDSKALFNQSFATKRLSVKKTEGKLMYAIYWIKLFFYLLFTKADAFCATDLDSIIPVYWASFFRRKKRIYDGHELFTEMKEVVTRPNVKKMWDWIEKKYLPRFQHGYTIGPAYASYFKEKYNLNYQVVRNATVLEEYKREESEEKFILYQGAVNEGRCFEQLLPAMALIPYKLIICGRGNYFDKAKEEIKRLHLEDRVFLKGYIPPQDLKSYTRKAHIGITLFDGISLSNQLSMANRYFDYMHAGVPQICMDFKEYQEVNKKYEIAYLIPHPPKKEKIAEGIKKLMEDANYHQKLQENCKLAREEFNWQNEEKTLIKFYHELFKN